MDEARRACRSEGRFRGERKVTLLKVISGGQTGADYAALVAASTLNFQTGGCMPKGFKTLKGPRPQYQEIFGVREHWSASYRDRTFENVRDSDATLRFAHDFTSAGERCTLKAIMEYQRPYMDVEFHLVDGEPHYAVAGTLPEEVAEWIAANKIQVLNVAGNAGEWFEPIVEDFFQRVLVLCQNTPYPKLRAV